MSLWPQTSRLLPRYFSCPDKIFADYHSFQPSTLIRSLSLVQSEQAAPQEATKQTLEFPSQSAPPVKSDGGYQLPEGNQWRYSEFINAVEAGKVERVRFSKDGSILQVRIDSPSLVALPNYHSWLGRPNGRAQLGSCDSSQNHAYTSHECCS